MQIEEYANTDLGPFIKTRLDCTTVQALHPSLCPS